MSDRDKAFQEATLAAYKAHVAAVNAAHRRRYDAEAAHVAECDTAAAEFRDALARIRREFAEEGR